MSLKYLWQYTPEASRWMSRNIVVSSVALVLGSCAPLEIFPHDQLNTDTVPQIQNNPLPFQSVHEILSWKSSTVEEDSLSGLFRSMGQSEKFVDDNWNIFTRKELESSDQ